MNYRVSPEQKRQHRLRGSQAIQKQTFLGISTGQDSGHGGVQRYPSPKGFVGKRRQIDVVGGRGPILFAIYLRV